MKTRIRETFNVELSEILDKVISDGKSFDAIRYLEGKIFSVKSSDYVAIEIDEDVHIDENEVIYFNLINVLDKCENKIRLNISNDSISYMENHLKLLLELRNRYSREEVSNMLERLLENKPCSKGCKCKASKK